MRPLRVSAPSVPVPVTVVLVTFNPYSQVCKRCESAERVHVRPRACTYLGSASAEGSDRGRGARGRRVRPMNQPKAYCMNQPTNARDRYESMRRASPCDRCPYNHHAYLFNVTHTNTSVGIPPSVDDYPPLTTHACDNWYNHIGPKCNRPCLAPPSTRTRRRIA